MKEIVFSPTGGTRKVADAICKGIGDEVEVIDLCVAGDKLKPVSLTGDDFALISFPVYGGRVPALAALRLGAIRANGARCARMCPVGAISESDLRRVDKSRCISCMRCISVCPEGARSISTIMHFLVKVALKKPCAERKKNELFI